MASPSPPSLPTEEEIGAFLKLRDEMVTDAEERTDEERAESARAIIALFAPILAEKERETIEATERMEEVAREWSKMLIRAQAAEAALASAREEERERCAKVARALSNRYASMGATMLDKAHGAADAADSILVSAIRAQGE